MQLLIFGHEQMVRHELHIKHPLVDYKEYLEIDLLTVIKITFFWFKIFVRLGVQLVEALRYMLESLVFDSR